MYALCCHTRQVRDVGSVFLGEEFESLQELNLDGNVLVEVSGACGQCNALDGSATPFLQQMDVTPVLNCAAACAVHQVLLLQDAHACLRKAACATVTAVIVLIARA